MRNIIVVFVFIVSLSTFLPHTAWSQETLGYTDPSDISNVLDYRLPDWSYRNWDVDFGFGNSGNELRDSGLHSNRNGFGGNLGSRFYQKWESEQRKFSLGGSLSGNYSRSHSGNDSQETKRHNLRLNYEISSSMSRYLAGSPFFAKLSGSTKRTYSESISDTRIDDIWDKNKSFHRTKRHHVFAGFGFGHLRNVVPLLRAQRLSERLVTMGRSALSPQQVQQIAEVLSLEFWYERVFDRSDRHFWVDVLSPMLDESNPLTAFEIFYLTDILNEKIGSRYQGFSIETGFTYGESNSNGRITDQEEISRTPILHIRWYHNFSLTNQIHFAGRYKYRDRVSFEHLEYDLWGTSDNGRFSTEIGHLWNFTDRYTLTSTLEYYKGSDIDDERRNQRVELQSKLQVYLEDRVSLTTGLNLSYNHEWIGAQEDFDWRWSYSFGLRYDLDRAFF